MGILDGLTKGLNPQEDAIRLEVQCALAHLITQRAGDFTAVPYGHYILINSRHAEEYPYLLNYKRNQADFFSTLLHRFSSLEQHWQKVDIMQIKEAEEIVNLFSDSGVKEEAPTAPDTSSEDKNSESDEEDGEEIEWDTNEYRKRRASYLKDRARKHSVKVLEAMFKETTHVNKSLGDIKEKLEHKAREINQSIRPSDQIPEGDMLKVAAEIEIRHYAANHIASRRDNEVTIIPAGNQLLLNYKLASIYPNLLSIVENLGHAKENLLSNDLSALTKLNQAHGFYEKIQAKWDQVGLSSLESITSLIQEKESEYLKARSEGKTPASIISKYNLNPVLDEFRNRDVYKDFADAPGTINELQAKIF